PDGLPSLPEDASLYQALDAMLEAGVEELAVTGPTTRLLRWSDAMKAKDSDALRAKDSDALRAKDSDAVRARDSDALRAEEATP
ncbi:MAG: hypothetical protein ACRDT1_14110, partial [Micromonosporaceae bacterium]